MVRIKKFLDNKVNKIKGDLQKEMEGMVNDVGNKRA